MENELPPPSLSRPRLSERTKASKPGTAKCLATGCRAMIPIDTPFCDHCVALLHDDVRAALGKHYRPGKKQSQAFRETLEIARDEIEYALAVGHRVPRDAELP